MPTASQVSLALDLLPLLAHADVAALATDAAKLHKRIFETLSDALDTVGWTGGAPGYGIPPVSTDLEAQKAVRALTGLQALVSGTRAAGIDDATLAGLVRTYLTELDTLK